MTPVFFCRRFFLLLLGVCGCVGEIMANDDISTNGLLTLRLFLVRHGETISNREGKVAGQAESALTEQGERQAVALGKSGRLKLGTFWRIYASDLQRTQTTRLILQGYNDNSDTSNDKDGSCPQVTLEPRLRELSKGARQGYPKAFSTEQALEVRRQEAQARGETLQDADVPATETERDAYTRFLKWLRDAAGDAVRDANSDNQQQVLSALVVSHSALLRAVLTHMFSKEELLAKGPKYDSKNPSRLLIPNTSLTVLDILINLKSGFWKAEPNGDDKEEVNPLQSALDDDNHDENGANGSIWHSKLQELTWTGHYELV